MSRSRRHQPIFGSVVCDSEKQDKRYARRQLRAALRQVKDDEQVIPTLRDVSNVWRFGKDGKRWAGSMDRDELHKDMRK